MIIHDEYDRCSECNHSSRSTLETVLARHDDRIHGWLCDRCVRALEANGWVALLTVVPD